MWLFADTCFVDASQIHHNLILVIVSCRVLPELKSPEVEVKREPPRRAASPARPPPSGQSDLPAILSLTVGVASASHICLNPRQIPPTQTSCPTSGGLGAQSEETYGPGTHTDGSHPAPSGASLPKIFLYQVKNNIVILNKYPVQFVPFALF